MGMVRSKIDHTLRKIGIISAMSFPPRHTRYQAAIMIGSQLLLIRHEEHQGGRTYWLLPGAGAKREKAKKNA